MKTKRVLIAQLNCVRSYRIRFYELLEARRPSDWTFEVIHDVDPDRVRRLFPFYVDPQTFRFPIHPVRTIFFRPRPSEIIWQTFFWNARRYDLVITDTYLSNLTYFFVHAWGLAGVRRGYWGHSGHITILPEQQHGGKHLMERLKRALFRSADVCFAYTGGEKQRFEAAGVPSERIVVLNNTIDIVGERATYMRLREERDSIRKELGLEGRDVVLYLGRLLAIKRLDVLFEGFRHLRRIRPNAVLVVAGGGPARDDVLAFAREMGDDAVKYFEPQNEVENAQLLVASDVYCLPGQVGLAPLRALCYDLPVVLFDLPFNSVEFEYFNSRNATILPATASTEELGAALAQSLDEWCSAERRAGLYASIAHLTMEAMVDRFIAGVNATLGIGN